MAVHDKTQSYLGSSRSPAPSNVVKGAEPTLPDPLISFVLPTPAVEALTAPLRIGDSSYQWLAACHEKLRGLTRRFTLSGGGAVVLVSVRYFNGNAATSQFSTTDQPYGHATFQSSEANAQKIVFRFDLQHVRGKTMSRVVITWEDFLAGGKSALKKLERVAVHIKANAVEKQCNVAFMFEPLQTDTR